MKHFTSKFILVAVLALLAACRPASERLSFAVISDVHAGSQTGSGSLQKVPHGLRHITAQGPLDALVMVGDITDRGSKPQFEELASYFSAPDALTKPVDQLIFMMGNHDNIDPHGQKYYQETLSPFNGGEPYPLFIYRTIKGYPFVTVSLLGPSSKNMYPQSTLEWLQTTLKQAATDCPGKPIFVFTHVPPQHSCYSTWPEFENGSSWGSTALNEVLNAYPQVVLFAGHSHFPLRDPRSIHQGVDPQSVRHNYFTVVNTGSTTYTEIHPGAVDEGIHPPHFEDIIEGLVVNELANGNIEIKRIDMQTGQEIAADQRWVLREPFDGSQFCYADTRDADDNAAGRPMRDGLPGPEFAEGVQLSVEGITRGVVVRIPQATDNECVFSYAIRVIPEGEDEAVFTYRASSLYYMNGREPDTIECNVLGLEPSSNYTIEVVASDSYDNPSAALVAQYTTPADGADDVAPAPEVRFTFDNTKAPLTAAVGKATLEPMLNAEQTVKPATLKQAGIVPAPGVPEAIAIPGEACLMARLPIEQTTGNYTLMLDFAVEQGGPFDALYQMDPTNITDADIFVHNGMVGVGDLGWGGKVEPNKWHRLVLVNRDGRLSSYLDARPLQTAGSSRWKLNAKGLLLCADNDGERTPTLVSQFAFWSQPLTLGQVMCLGKAEAGSLAK